jgi:hypothetical protein
MSGSRLQFIRWTLAALVVVCFIGLSQHQNDRLTLPLILLLMIFGFPAAMITLHIYQKRWGERLKKIAKAKREKRA